jgi:hypothetical protein
LAPTVLSSVWTTINATVITRMVACFVPSSEMPNRLLISVVRYGTTPVSTLATVTSRARP